jgi:hypothetical protein
MSVKEVALDLVLPEDRIPAGGTIRYTHLLTRVTALTRLEQGDGFSVESVTVGGIELLQKHQLKHATGNPGVCVEFVLRNISDAPRLSRPKLWGWESR